MYINWIWFIFYYLLAKSGEIVLNILLEKLWEWVLKSDRLDRLATSLKLQILILYLDRLLKQNPLPPASDRTSEKDE